MAKKTDMRKGLTSYGDEGFLLFLRKAFIKAMAIPTMRWTGRSSACRVCAIASDDAVDMKPTISAPWAISRP